MFQNWIISIQGILKYVSDNTGLNITDIIAAEEVFDTLLIEKENNYPLPRWVDDSTYKSLEEISDMTFYFDYSTKLVQRLRTGENCIKFGIKSNLDYCRNFIKFKNFFYFIFFRFTFRRHVKTYERSYYSIWKYFESRNKLNIP
jgi:hypothetical protein